VIQLGSLAGLVILSLFYPLIESLDGWDSPLPASDLEINVIGLLTFVGVAFVLAHLLASVVGSGLVSFFRQFFRRVTTSLALHDGTLDPVITASPPVPLRI
jgi:hypothetical protein